MAYDKHMPPSKGGSLTVDHGMDAGTPGEGKTCNMQNTHGTRLPMGGAPKRHGGKKSGSHRGGKDY